MTEIWAEERGMPGMYSMHPCALHTPGNCFKKCETCKGICSFPKIMQSLSAN